MKGQKTGGRQKGTPNKTTAIREAEIAASGLTPKDYFLAILRAEPKPLPPDATPDEMQKWLDEFEAFESRRFAAAKELLPFCHARLSSVEANAQITIAEDWVDKLE